MAVALFGATDSTVTAIWGNCAQIGALSGPVGICVVSGSQVTLLRTILYAVPTVIRKRAIGIAGSIAAIVNAVIALFVRIFEAIATLEMAARIASAARGAVAGTVVALLAGV